VLQIRIRFSAAPDPDFYLQNLKKNIADTDPDPDSHNNVALCRYDSGYCSDFAVTKFYMKNILFVDHIITGHETYPYVR
jgi:hypothetical protein